MDQFSLLPKRLLHCIIIKRYCHCIFPLRYYQLLFFKRKVVKISDLEEIILLTISLIVITAFLKLPF